VAAHDPEVRRASARLAGAIRVAGLDADGRRAMNEPARAALASAQARKARREAGAADQQAAELDELIAAEVQP
jgi:hypothetical protein